MAAPADADQETSIRPDETAVAVRFAGTAGTCGATGVVADAGSLKPEGPVPFSARTRYA